MNKKIPMRTCVVSNEKLPKKELIRIVRNTDGKVYVDQSGKMNGRGVYLKLNEDIINLAKKNKILSKKLETEVPDNIYEELINLIR